MRYAFSAWLRRFRAATDLGTKAPTPILLASSREEDAASLREILGHERWTVVQAPEWADVLALQEEFSSPIVLYDREFSGVPWPVGVQAVARAARAPVVVLISSVADPYLWDEVVSAGGFDVLPRPFRRNETLAMIDLAHTFWKIARPPSGLTTTTGLS
jgi:PleD family two-component response regulator